MHRLWRQDGGAVQCLQRDVEWLGVSERAADDLGRPAEAPQGSPGGAEPLGMRVAQVGGVGRSWEKLRSGGVVAHILWSGRGGKEKKD